MDRDAFDVVMGFAERWKPARRFLLGDIYDFAAFRSGAKGTADEARKLPEDLSAGNGLIMRYRPTDVVIGNHDFRVFKLAEHPSGIVSHAAGMCVKEFRDSCEAVKVKRLVDHYNIQRSWIDYHGTKFCHGWMYNEHALRDHAEHFGNCVMAHLHVPDSSPGRRSDSPVAHCVGMLGDARRLDYAHGRRATSRWALGFAWGEASGDTCMVRVERCFPGLAKNWRLPF